MDNRLFKSLVPYLTHLYPDAIAVRNRIAALPSSHDRIMAVKDLSHGLLNAICCWIMEEIRDTCIRYDLAAARHLVMLDMCIAHESRLRHDAQRSAIYLMDTKIRVLVTVQSLERTAAQFQLNDIPEDSRQLWQELADWFNGKYQSLAQKTNRKVIKRNLIGNYPFVDANDRIFWLFTHARWLDFVMPFHHIANIINQRIATIYPPAPSAPPEEIEASAPPLTDNEISETSESSARPEFECPLTLKTMKSPAICTLDGCSYEASVLQETLEQYGRTPTNIVIDKAHIPDIMLPNVNLLHAIKQYRADESEVECYLCPITGKSMQEAMFCTLDKISYEKAAILEYLSTKMCTPSGAQLPGDKKSQDVLIPNITLRKAIESCQELKTQLRYKGP